MVPALLYSALRNVYVGSRCRKDIEAEHARIVLDGAAEVVAVPDDEVAGPALLLLNLKNNRSAYDCELVRWASEGRKNACESQQEHSSGQQVCSTPSSANVTGYL